MLHRRKKSAKLALPKKVLCFLRSNEHPLEKGLSCVNMRATAMDAKGL
jgi:hypothetical protein